MIPNKTEERGGQPPCQPGRPAELSPWLKCAMLAAAEERRFMAEDIFDVVNERDEVIGAKPRREVHARGWLHRAVHVFVFNSRGEIFLQKRSMKKDRQPGVWDSSCSGHVDSGETYDDAAVRELGEELGLKRPPPLEKLFKIAACAETDGEFVWLYRCQYEGPLRLAPDEIETGVWFAPEQVSTWIREKPVEFATACVLIWKLYPAPQRASGGITACP